jgi:hypothetical protein
MSTPTQPQPPQWGQPGYAPPAGPPPLGPPAKRSRKRWLLILASIPVAFIVLGLIAAILAPADPVTAPSATRAATVATQPPTTEAPIDEPMFATPKPRDFKLTVKVLEKANFGSAGSNITYRIVADWSGTYDPDKTYEATYEVRGGEDGPAVNTFTVTGDEYQVEKEEFISTGTVGQKLTARVTSVDEA